MDVDTRHRWHTFFREATVLLLKHVDPHSIVINATTRTANPSAHWSTTRTRRARKSLKA